MSHLLKLVKFDKVKPSIKPLAFEFQANNDATPFLVSTSKSLLWVTEAPANVVRAAVRSKTTTKIQDFYLEVLQEISDVSRECSWGNLQPLTRQGFKEASAYISYYGVETVECLLNGESKTSISEILKGTGVSYSICNWLPKDLLVVVPKDRSLLGFVGVINTGFVSVIQNPSRCIAICGEI